MAMNKKDCTVPGFGHKAVSITVSGRISWFLFYYMFIMEKISIRPNIVSFSTAMERLVGSETFSYMLCSFESMQTQQVVKKKKKASSHLTPREI